MYGTAHSAILLRPGDVVAASYHIETKCLKVNVGNFRKNLTTMKQDFFGEQMGM
jgi:hypothetical protein